MSDRTEETHVALCSGGRDSVAAAHYAMTNGLADRVVFLHTLTDPVGVRSAIDATIEWLADWCRENGWRFEVAEAPTRFDEIVADNGYPGFSRHYLMYRRLKDRPIDTYRQTVDGDLHCWTGIRRWESDNRMEVAEAEGERGDGRWYWHAPLVDWHDADVSEYLDRFDIRPSPLVEELGRSADCWCGCFGDPNELVDLAAAGFEEHADWLRDLETPDDCPRDFRQWAGTQWDKSDWADADENQPTLCASCRTDKTGSGNGGGADE